MALDLDNHNLARHRLVSFEPALNMREQFKHVAPPLGFQIDGLLSPDDIMYGSSSFSLETLDEQSFPSFSCYDEMEIYNLIIKKPGESEHHLPAELVEAEPNLLPVLQKIANHQFATSPHARDKSASLGIRRVQVDPTKIPGGIFWHLDFFRDEEEIEETENNHLPPFHTEEEWRIIRQYSYAMNSNDYLLSNKIPTIVQTRRNDVFLDSIKVIEGVPYLSRPPLHFRQAQPFEVIVKNSATYHRAAPLDGLSFPTLTHRTFISVFYNATQKMEDAALKMEKLARSKVSGMDLDCA